MSLFHDLQNRIAKGKQKVDNLRNPESNYLDESEKINLVKLVNYTNLQEEISLILINIGAESLKITAANSEVIISLKKRVEKLESQLNKRIDNES